MRRDITPDMYNYNKYPGPIFVTFGDQVKSDELVFTIVKNTSETFDAESFSQRFSEILLKYDYIVGDWGNEQLRLRGFYKQDSQKNSLSGISRLDDYLKEYCNFGCAYFILENPEPKEVVFEEEKVPARRRQRRRKPAAGRRSEAAAQVSPKGEQANFKKKSRRESAKPRRGQSEQQGNQPQKHFKIRQKDNG